MDVMSSHRVLVTGASHGIGLATAETLAQAGSALALCARDGLKLRRAVDDLATRFGVTVHAEPLDVTAPEGLEAFVASSAAALGGLDGLVVNAGGSFGRGLPDSTPEDWAATWALNVGQAERAIRTAAPHLAASGHGSVVLVSSISGWKPAPGAQYGSAKAAQIYLAAAWARELGADGIRVNAVSPGSTRVPDRRWDRMSRDDPEAFAAFMKEFPGGRLVEPSEIAEVIAFLLSPAASGISGANIPVDRAQNAPGASGY
ncbi:SDR family NAD(P)-dependent oxidoreductase [Catenulispora pinisilvae]|uniref:SDR family NAD(P)-dependent oxidoreductase n=1 Tax=Catenulispora pinisilvae TaxID=2705253 RepID=UPI001890ED68|nr:SDR family oxidoreductase [Catenulispora pinisilvae]